MGRVKGSLEKYENQRIAIEEGWVKRMVTGLIWRARGWNLRNKRQQQSTSEKSDELKLMNAYKGHNVVKIS